LGGASARQKHKRPLSPPDTTPTPPYTHTTRSEPATDGTNDHLGTPGGDFAELATAIYTYCEVAGVDCSVSLVKDAFDLFMKKVATNNRPFYLHQSEAKINGILSQLFPDFAGSPVGTNRERPASMPVVAPSDAERWYEQLVVGTNQGCGHVRLMIQQPNDFGLDKWPDVVPNLLRIFYEYWWPTPLGSKQRQRIEFPILQGELEGDAVLVVDAAGKSGACSHKSPSVTHAWYGGQAFVYNGAAVADFRAVTLTNLFADFAKTRGDKAFGAAKFTAALQELQTKQLFAVLTELVPANTCPILTVSFQK